MTADRVLRLHAAPAAAPAVLRVFGLAAIPDTPGPESWIQLFKTGAFYDWRYGDFSITTDDLVAMMSNFQARPTGVPGDYDHSFSEGAGSKAAGWIQDLELRADGQELWGHVAWTQAAADAIAAGEYRFISPEFSFNHVNERGEAVGPTLLAFALTNRPFLEGMAEVSLAAGRDGRVLLRAPKAAGGRTDPNMEDSEHMDLEKLRKALRLADDAGEDAILAEVVRLSSTHRPDAVVLSRAEVEELRAKAKAGEDAAEELRLSQRAAVIDGAIKDGRLAPASRDRFEALYDLDPKATTLAIEALPKHEGFKADADNAKAVDAPGAGDDDTAPIGERIERRALELQAAQPGLGYEDALYLADAQLRPKEVAS